MLFKYRDITFTIQQHQQLNLVIQCDFLDSPIFIDSHCDVVLHVVTQGMAQEGRKNVQRPITQKKNQQEKAGLV